nr:hypothetical protein [bacterium]
MTTNFWRKNKALGIFFIAGVIFLTSAITYITVAAPTTWTQTDWSGGQSNDVVVAAADLGNLYKAASPYVDVSQSGEISVSNITVNSAFDTDVTDWNYSGGPGSNLTWSDILFYSGNGSAKLASDFDSSTTLYQNITVSEAGNYILSAYVYYNDQAINSSIAQLYYDGSPIDTNYEHISSNWYRLTATIADDASGAKDYGVYKVMANPLSMYIDDIELYEETNILTSSIFDMENPQFWANLAYTTDGLGTTTVKVRTGDAADLSDANTFDNPACTDIASDTDLTDNGCVDDGDRYLQYQIQFSPAYTTTVEYPTFEEISLQGNISTVQFDTDNDNDTEADIIVQIPISLNGVLEEDASVDYTIT